MVTNIVCFFSLTILLIGGAESSEMVSVKAVFPSKEMKAGATRLVLRGTLPDINDVSVCVWANAAGVLKPKGNFIVSYAHGKAANELLVGVIPAAGDSVRLQMSVGDQDAFIVTDKFAAGQWHHLCFCWSSGKGRVSAYVDGEFAGKTTSAQLEGKTIRSGGVLVVAQDQDIFNGKFDPDEAWEGALADLQIWDEVLKPETIEALAKCKIHMEGNLVAWMKTPFRAIEGVDLSSVHLCKGVSRNLEGCRN